MIKTRLSFTSILLLFSVLLFTTGCPYLSKVPMGGTITSYDPNIIGNWHDGKKVLTISRIDDEKCNIYFMDPEAEKPNEINGKGTVISFMGDKYLQVKTKDGYYVARFDKIFRDHMKLQILDDLYIEKGTLKTTTDFTDSILLAKKIFPYNSYFTRNGTVERVRGSDYADVFFSEDFKDNRNEWQLVNGQIGDSVQSRIIYDELQMKNSTSENSYTVFVPYILPVDYNYSFKVSLKSPDGVSGYGIKFSMLDVNNYYGIYFSESGKYMVMKNQKGIDELLVPMTANSYLKKYTNEIEIKIRQNSCEFYFNDHFITTLKNFIPFGPKSALEVLFKQSISFDGLMIKKL